MVPDVFEVEVLVEFTACVLLLEESELLYVHINGLFKLVLIRAHGRQQNWRGPVARPPPPRKEVVNRR